MADGLTVPFALGVFSFVKGRFSSVPALRSLSQTRVTGALASMTAFVLTKLIV
jgi:hypothetical protein